jgi:type VI secretion system protein ImpA
MASPDVDFQKLLAPISAEKPTGADPRGDTSHTSLYQRTRTARSEARAAERRSAAGDEGEAAQASPPDWKTVRDLGLKTLTEQAKDLEITAYVIEAFLRLYDFAGLRDGFRLARELIEKYWDALYPTPDEEGLATRIAPLVGLNGDDAEGTLIAPITRVPMTDTPNGERFSRAHYNEANLLKKTTDPKLLQKKLEGGAISLELFQRAVQETKPEFYQALVNDLKACMAEFTKLGEALDKRCQGRGPPTSNIRAALTECMDIIQQVAREKLAALAEKPEAAPKEAAPAPGGAPVAKPAAPGVIQTRDQALDTLTKVAEFFRKTEPHSPLSYTLDQAVRWGRTPLPELLAELIDEAARKALFTRIGIRTADDGKGAPAPPVKKP